MNNLINIKNIEYIYHIISLNTKHREKLFKFELMYSSNITYIHDIIKYNKYKHGNYNIFLISDPKYRIIMSESIMDKVINHLISRYILLPVIDPLLIKENIATRENKGLKMGMYYTKKYINELKTKYDNFYILKCDIHKYFYNIDHTILLNKLYPLIKDNNILNMIKSILSSTYNKDTNNRIEYFIKKERESLIKGNNLDRLDELNKIPLYKEGIGLPIGNMTSQIFAIFYLNDLDHFIKEKLHIKYYIRYMDDFILLHKDKKYLEYCLKEIKKEIGKINLKLNDKTKIISIKDGLNFLGYRYVLKGKKLICLLGNKSKKRIVKKLNKLRINKPDNYKAVLASYKGYFIKAKTKNLLYKGGWYKDD